MGVGDLIFNCDLVESWWCSGDLQLSMLTKASSAKRQAVGSEDLGRESYFGLVFQKECDRRSRVQNACQSNFGAVYHSESDSISVQSALDCTILVK